MNKKTVIALVISMAVLVAGIAYGVFRLYGDSFQITPAKVSPAEQFPLLSAVPSDAAAVFCFDGSDAARRLLKDSTGILSAVVAPGTDAHFRDYLVSISDAPAAISLHNSGSLIPLVLAQLKGREPDAVMRLSAQAEAAGLKTLWIADAGFLVASRSETLLNSSKRHFSESISILNAEGLSGVAASLAGGNAAFLCNRDAVRLGQSLLSRSARRSAGFFSRFADWTGFALSVEDGFTMTGTASARDDAGYYLNVLRTAPGAARFPEMLPVHTASAVSVITGDIAAYIAARKRYLDAQGKLDTFSKGVEQFALQKNLSEAAVAEFAGRDSMEKVLLLRCGKRPDGQKVIRENIHAGAPAVLFGSLFQLKDERACVSLGDWIVIGSRKTLEAYVNGGLLDRSLKSWLADGGAAAFEGRNLHAAVYYAAGESAEPWGVCAEPLRSALTGAERGHAALPVLGTVTSDRTHITLMLRAKEISASKLPGGEDPAVEVPAGPFRVKNCGTGKINTFYQNADLALCLKDETGKALWGVPFQNPICGRVEEVDYYANGKIQFLFAAADELYLIDRLGRFVKGFPVRLGKRVLLGPDVYDFSGAHSYRIMALHTDNTIEMYDLHGRKPQQWQGIAAPESVKGLPELIEHGGKKYWAVSAASGALLIYPFYGGAPVPKKEAKEIAGSHYMKTN